MSPSPSSPSRPTVVRSRRELRPAATVWPSTTNCCVSKSSSVRAPRIRASPPLRAKECDREGSTPARRSELLGRSPQGDFEVVTRGPDGGPEVIRNAPLLEDGTPMPTRYWLVDRDLVRRVSRLEADGGVRAAEAVVDPERLRRTHAE